MFSQTATEVRRGDRTITLIGKDGHCAQSYIYCLLGAVGGGANDVAGRVSPLRNTIGPVWRTGAVFVWFMTSTRFCGLGS